MYEMTRKSLFVRVPRDNLMTSDHLHHFLFHGNLIGCHIRHVGAERLAHLRQLEGPVMKDCVVIFDGGEATT